MRKPYKKVEVVETKPADENHQVLSLKGGRGDVYRKTPCSDCPWRKDAVGEFPAEAFRISAHTAYDMNQSSFGCHQSGKDKPATCAGFLLKGSKHNLGVRLGILKGDLKDDVTDGGVELFDSYREMAVANGVDPEDPVLRQCRD